MRPIGSAAELERRRIRAVELVEQGESPSMVAHILGVHPTSLHRWRRQARQGLGLEARPHPGRRPSLSDEQVRQLERGQDVPIPAEHGCHFGSGGVGPFCSRLRTERMTTAIAMLLAATAISALLIFSPSEINAQKLSTKSKIDIPISTNPQINCQRRLLC
jgi:transposase-like protein